MSEFDNIFTVRELAVLTSDKVRGHFDAIFKEFHRVDLKDVTISLCVMKENKGTEEIYRMAIYEDDKVVTETVSGKRIHQMVINEI